jgi:hypothetical protein
MFLLIIVILFRNDFPDKKDTMVSEKFFIFLMLCERAAAGPTWKNNRIGMIAFGGMIKAFCVKKNFSNKKDFPT